MGTRTGLKPVQSIPGASGAPGVPDLCGLPAFPGVPGLSGMVATGLFPVARVAVIPVLVAGDLLGLVLAFGASLAVRVYIWPRFGLPPFPLLGEHLALWPALALWLFGYAVQGLYPGYGLGMVEKVRRFTLAGLLAFMFLVAGTFLFRTGHIYSRSVLFLGWLLSLFTVPAGRALARSLLVRLDWWGTPAVV